MPSKCFERFLKSSERPSKCSERPSKCSERPSKYFEGLQKSKCLRRLFKRFEMLLNASQKAQKCRKNLRIAVVGNFCLFFFNKKVTRIQHHSTEYRSTHSRKCPPLQYLKLFSIIKKCNFLHRLLVKQISNAG